MNNNETAVIYARFSSDNQREESIDAQVRACRRYAEQQGYNIIEIYADHAKTGTNDKRPEFQRVIQDAKSGKFAVLIVHKFDRFSRDKVDSAIYKRELKKAGVKLKSVCEPLDGSPESIMMEGIYEAYAQYYSANLSREVMKGMLENAHNCKHTGGKPPLGYDVDPATKKYVVNQREAEAVKLIFERYTAGAGYDTLMRELNAAGYKTKLGKPFGKNSIHDILINEKYSGVYIFNRAAAKDVAGKRNNRKAKSTEAIMKIPGGMPAIIAQETFDAVQEKITGKKRAPGSYRAKENYLLSGLVVCGECQKNGLSHSMVGNRVFAGRNKRLYITYRCSNKDRTNRCTNLDVRKEYLEEYVMHTLVDVFFDEQTIASVVKQVNQRIASSCEQVNHQLASAKIEQDAVVKQMEHIVEAIANGFKHETMLKKFNALEEEKTKIEARIREMQEKQQQKTVSEEYLKQLVMAAKSQLIQLDGPELKDFIRAYVKRIVAYQEKIVVEFQFPVVGMGGGGEGNRTPVLITYHQLFAVTSDISHPG